MKTNRISLILGWRVLTVSILSLCSLSLAMAGSKTTVEQTMGNVDIENVTFDSGGNVLSGFLVKPKEGEFHKAVTIIGPVASVKEQAPIEYALRLAAEGFIALVFDPTYHGASEGIPRRYESGVQKTKDIMASIDFLESLATVDKDNIYGVGVCQGVNWMISAANKDDRIKSVSLVAGHYLTPEVAEMYTGGKLELAQRLVNAQLAKDKFDSTGEVEYIPIVSLDNPDALLRPKPIYDWYIPWESNKEGRQGKWENRITRMSELDIWGGNAQEKLEKLTKPTLMIHSDKAASGPVIPKNLFNLIPAGDKELVWFEDQFQTEFYEDDATISRTVSHIGQWFNK